MEVKSFSSTVLAQQKHTSDDPLGRILDPLGFYRHPILYAPVLILFLFTFVCRQYGEADAVVITART
jgi:hypothetical protein